MKLIKKIAAIMLSVMMVLGMASVVSADEGGTAAATGNGKITITNAIPSQTYKIYRILELEIYNTTTGNYAYKATATWKPFIESNEIKDVYVTINDGYVTWKDNADVATFAKKALAYANTQNHIINSDKSQIAPAAAAGATTSTVAFSDLPLGYYLVDSSAGALCSLDTTATEVRIQEKNGVPSVEKKVQEDSKVGKTDEWGKSNTADIGQTVNFQTTITAQQGAQNYVLHDKMSDGLTFDSIKSITKKNGTAIEATNYTLKKSTDSSPSITDGCTFEIEFTQPFCNTLGSNDQIIVTYSATLNENAVIAGDGNKNTTKLTYGDSSKTTPSTTTTKTFELPVFKYTGTDTPLKDAEFELKRNNETIAIALIKKTPVKGETYTGDIYQVAKTGETETVTKVKTTNSGKFKIQGLDADTYCLTETKQPDGYNKLSAPITVVIDENGTITVDSKTVDEVKVQNNTGTILPTTGGNGTSLIYFLGAVLALVSGVVLITKQRMKNS